MNYLLEGSKQALGLLRHGDAATYSAIFTSIKVSISSIVISLVFGIPLGFKIGINNFTGKKALKFFLSTILSLPTVVIGLLVYLLVANEGLFGSFNLLFTIYAIIIGQTILVLPIIVILTANTIDGVNKNLILNLTTLGATKKQTAFTILWEMRHAIFSVALVAYGRIISEVGISMIVGGNIKWYTRTIPTAITLAANKGEFATSVALGMILLLLTLLVNLAGTFLKKQALDFKENKRACAKISIK